MKQKKIAKLLKKSLETHFACHSVRIKLHLCQVDTVSKRFLYDVKLMPGTRVAAVFDRTSDVGEALQLPLLRVFREGDSIHLIASFTACSENSLRKMLCSQAFLGGTAQLPVALGYDLMGRKVFDDLSQMPHAMYVGATNSGKSTGLISLILSLVCSCPANELNLVVLDVGGNSLQVFEGIPHLSHPIVKTHTEAIHILRELSTEMHRRIELDKQEREQLHPIVCVVDEYVSFVQNIRDAEQRQEVKSIISDLLRRGRGVKVHMVLATQDPRKDAMGIDIGNITSRMAFKVPKYQSSVNVLNAGGAEKLPGKGAMLYVSSEHPEPVYVQGAFMPQEEVWELLERVREFECDRSGMFNIAQDVPADENKTITIPAVSAKVDDGKERELAEIIAWVLSNQTVSVNQIKQRFSIGNRANDIMETLCTLGLVGEKAANKPRKVLIQQLEEIPTAVATLLAKNGYTAGTEVTSLELDGEVNLL